MNHVHTRLNEIFIYLVPDFLGVRFLIDSFNDTRCHFIVFSDFRFAVRPIVSIYMAYKKRVNTKAKAAEYTRFYENSDLL